MSSFAPDHYTFSYHVWKSGCKEKKNLECSRFLCYIFGGKIVANFPWEFICNKKTYDWLFLVLRRLSIIGSSRGTFCKLTKGILAKLLGYQEYNLGARYLFRVASYSYYQNLVVFFLFSFRCMEASSPALQRTSVLFI